MACVDKEVIARTQPSEEAVAIFVCNLVHSVIKSDVTTGREMRVCIVAILDEHGEQDGSFTGNGGLAT